MNNDLCHGIWKHTSPHLRYKVYIYSVCQLSGVKHTFNGRTPMWIEEIVWKSCLDRKMFINVLFCCFVFLSFVVECVLIVFFAVALFTCVVRLICCWLLSVDLKKCVLMMVIARPILPSPPPLLYYHSMFYITS